MITIYTIIKKEIKTEFCNLLSIDIFWYGNYIRFLEVVRCDCSIKSLITIDNRCIKKK